MTTRRSWRSSSEPFDVDAILRIAASLFWSWLILRRTSGSTFAAVARRLALAAAGDGGESMRRRMAIAVASDARDWRSTSPLSHAHQRADELFLTHRMPAGDAPFAGHLGEIFGRIGSQRGRRHRSRESLQMLVE